MKVAMNENYSDVETLSAVIAHSQIVVAECAGPSPALPAGFDEVDIAILDWIAAEGRVVRRLVQM
jgi:hypothetical protein